MCLCELSILEIPISQNIILICPWKVCIFPRAFHNNSLCKVSLGGIRVNYGELENSQFPNSSHIAK